MLTLLTGRNIEFRFQAPAEDLTLDAETRREVFLVFKEAVHNLVRHSGCTEASIDLCRQGDSLVLRVSDNGKGFAPDQVTPGQGSRRALGPSWGRWPTQLSSS